jgi:hypothetical protein
MNEKLLPGSYSLWNGSGTPKSIDWKRIHPGCIHLLVVIAKQLFLLRKEGLGPSSSCIIFHKIDFY